MFGSTIDEKEWANETNAYMKKLEMLSKAFPINPLKIVDDPEINKDIIVPDVSGLFKNDLLANGGIIKRVKKEVTQKDVVDIMIYLTIGGLVNYKENWWGYLPMAAVNQVINLMNKAISYIGFTESQKTSICNDYNSAIRNKIFQQGIIEETNIYWNKINNAKNV